MPGFPAPDSRNPTLPLFLSALSGLAVSMAIMKATGRREAWDSAHYFTKGIPVMCALNFDHIGLAQRSRLGARVAILRPERWSDVEAALLIACGFHK